MKKVTLKEQMIQIIENKKTIEKEQLDEFFKSNLKPKKIFSVSRIGEIKEIEIEYFSMSYYENGKRTWLQNYDVEKEKRPSKELIGIYNEFLHDMISKFEKCVHIHYREKTGTLNLSGAYLYNEIKDKSHLSFDKNELIIEAERLKNIYAPKENHIPCAYCGKQVQTNKIIKSNIIGRDRKQIWNSWKKRYESKSFCTNNVLNFCSNECAGNEQMSREG